MRSKFITLIVTWLIIIAGGNGAYAQLSASAGTDIAICANDTVTIGGNPTATGGTAPYRYSWSPATGLNSTSISNPIAQPSVSTWYHVTVTDNVGDTSVNAVAVSVKPLPLLSVTADSNPACIGSTVQLHAAAASPGCGIGLTTYNYNLGQIGNGNIVQSGNGYAPPSLFGNMNNSSRQQMLYTASELQSALGGPQLINGIAFNVALFNSNAYLLNFTISMGCTDIDSLTTWQDGLQEVLYYDAIQPAVSWNSMALDNEFYWDGVSGIVVDICFFNPSTFGNQNNKAQCSNTSFSSYLYAASYRTNLCGMEPTVTPTTQRPNIKLSYGTPVTSSYSYTWRPTYGPNAVTDTLIANPTAAPIQTTAYYVTATSPTGCKATDSITVLRTLPAIKDSFITQNALCFGHNNGSACVIITGGAPPYTHHWSTGDTALCVYNLAPGYYNISISDQNGCSLYDSATVAPQEEMYTSGRVKNVSCYGAQDGQITLTVYGGTVPYNYQWSNPSGVPDNLPGGNYFVTVTDANGCSVAELYIVHEPALLTLNLTASPVLCFGGNTGAITSLPTGGTQPYHYLWSNASRNPDQTGLVAGPYSLQLTDSNGCYAFDSTLITQPPALNASIMASSDSLLIGQMDTLTALASGGIPPYDFLWTGALPGPIIYVDQCGTYSVAITDSNGCVDMLSYTLAICYTDTTVGINPIEQIFPYIQIFPNPANDLLNITTGLAEIDEISIVDLTGQQVLHQNHLTGSNFTINISSLSAGVYLIDINVNGQQYHSRFVKANAK